MWTFIILFVSPSVQNDTQNDSSNIIRPLSERHICRNLSYGSVDWLQEARTIVPRSSGLICTSYILTTYAVLCFDLPLCSVLLLPPLLVTNLFSLSFTNATHAIGFLVFAVPSSCVATKGGCKERLRITRGPGGGRRMEIQHRSAGGQVPEDLQFSQSWTCPPLHPVWRLRVDLCCLSSLTNWTFNHRINDHYLCIPS